MKQYTYNKFCISTYHQIVLQITSTICANKVVNLCKNTPIFTCCYMRLQTDCCGMLSADFPLYVLMCACARGQMQCMVDLSIVKSPVEK